MMPTTVTKKLSPLCPPYSARNPSLLFRVVRCSSPPKAKRTVKCVTTARSSYWRPAHMKVSCTDPPFDRLKQPINVYGKPQPPSRRIDDKEKAVRHADSGKPSAQQLDRSAVESPT